MAAGSERNAARAADDHVVDEWDAEQLPCRAQPLGDVEVLPARLRVAARVVVGHDHGPRHLPHRRREHLPRVHHRPGEAADAHRLGAQRAVLVRPAGATTKASFCVAGEVPPQVFGSRSAHAVGWPRRRAGARPAPRRSPSARADASRTRRVRQVPAAAPRPGTPAPARTPHSCAPPAAVHPALSPALAGSRPATGPPRQRPSTAREGQQPRRSRNTLGARHIARSAGGVAGTRERQPWSGPSARADAPRYAATSAGCSAPLEEHDRRPRPPGRPASRSPPSRVTSSRRLAGFERRPPEVPPGRRPARARRPVLAATDSPSTSDLEGHAGVRGQVEHLVDADPR